MQELDGTMEQVIVFSTGGDMSPLMADYTHVLLDERGSFFAEEAEGLGRVHR